MDSVITNRFFFFVLLCLDVLRLNAGLQVFVVYIIIEETSEKERLLLVCDILDILSDILDILSEKKKK